MRLVTHLMSTSLDGYFFDRTGGIDWSAPDPDAFAAHLAEPERVP